jgi:hypothetical protein
MTTDERESIKLYAEANVNGNCANCPCALLCYKTGNLLFPVQEMINFCKKYRDENIGEWNKFTRKELLDKIQEIRQLVGSDGTRDICDDIKSYAENYNSAEHMSKREKISAIAMLGIIATNTPLSKIADHIANCAINYADALINKLEETK